MLTIVSQVWLPRTVLCHCDCILSRFCANTSIFGTKKSQTTWNAYNIENKRLNILKSSFTGKFWEYNWFTLEFYFRFIFALGKRFWYCFDQKYKILLSLPSEARKIKLFLRRIILFRLFSSDFIRKQPCTKFPEFLAVEFRKSPLFNIDFI